jgi:folate-dependent phosphoribosylglycinamide formyltransferase PurN
MAEGRPIGPRVVLLAGPGVSTHIVYHYLKQRYPDLVVVEERPAARVGLARRRARRLGWGTVAGQVAFVVLAMPLLAYRARARVRDIITAAGLDAAPIDDPILVASVNAPATVELLRGLDPDVVVVNGTRIISSSVLDAVGVPFVNLHMGITPAYRGVHGGYWALVDRRPDLVGTTIHLVDSGIDTGGVLVQARFAPTPRDSIVTYPYLHLVHGLPLLGEQIDRLLAADPAPAGDDGPVAAGESRLRWHPTLWRYLWERVAHGVR